MTTTKRWIDSPRIAVAIPCLNEESTVGKAIEDFRRALPESQIYVIDNASSDGTARAAESAGATVIHEKRVGKGWAIQRILSQIDADVVVLVDGDDTYPAEAVKKLIEPILADEADMVVANRLLASPSPAFAPLHRFGNRMIVRFVNLCFGTRFSDVLSGYRALSRQALREIAVTTRGFEIETELTIQALERGMLIREIPVHYRPRPEGSTSKLHAFADGYRILLTIVILMRDHRPFVFFSLVSSPFFVGSFVLGLLALKDYLATGTVPQTVTAVVAGLGLTIGVVLFLGGLILNAISTRIAELASVLTRTKRP